MAYACTLMPYLTTRIALSLPSCLVSQYRHTWRGRHGNIFTPMSKGTCHHLTVGEGASCHGNTFHTHVKGNLPSIWQLTKGLVATATFFIPMSKETCHLLTLAKGAGVLFSHTSQNYQREGSTNKQRTCGLKRYLQASAIILSLMKTTE